MPKGRYKYIIPGTPVPLQRARITGGRLWDAQKQLKINTGIVLANQHKLDQQFQGALGLSVKFYFTPAATHKKRWEALYGKHHFYKPDTSNLLKWVEDCANGILFRDDCQISFCECTKLYDAVPRTEFELWEL